MIQKRVMFGSVIGKQRTQQPDLPSYIAIPKTEWNAGYLGDALAPFKTNAVPRPGQPFQVAAAVRDPEIDEAVVHRIRRPLQQQIGDLQCQLEHLVAEQRQQGREQQNREQRLFRRLAPQETMQKFDRLAQQIAGQWLRLCGDLALTIQHLNAKFTLHGIDVDE